MVAGFVVVGAVVAGLAGFGAVLEGFAGRVGLAA